MADDLAIRLCNERTALEDANQALIERNANLEAEVARLREERHEWCTKCEDERAAHEATKAELDKAARIWAIDRDARAAAEARVAELTAAHEATKADLAKWQRNYAKVDADMSRQAELAESEYDKRIAAEQRVAELERACVNECSLRVQATDAAYAMQTALSSARELLQHAYDCMDNDGPFAGCMSDIDTWLRAHPEPATPARSCPRCGGIITQQTHVCPATPAVEDDEETAEEADELLSAGQRLPFVQVGMVVHHEDSPLSECMIVTEIYDANDGTDGMEATVLSRFGEPGVLTCRDLRQTFRLARDFDQRLTYTGRWGRMPRGTVIPEAEVERDA